MKIEKIIIIMTLVMAVFLSGIISCTQWSTRDWNELKDRKFYFQKFKYTYRGETKENAFNFMKSIPLTEALNIVAKRYDITIDVTEFQNFIYSGDYLKLKTSGIVQDEVFFWESKNKQVNQIEIEYEMRPELDAKSVLIIYKLLIKNNDEVRAFFYDRVYDRNDILKNLASSFGYGVSDTGKKEPGGPIDTKNRIIVADSKSRVSYNNNDVKNETEAIIKKQIALYVRGLKSDEREVFRADLVRFINEICK
jgi:hypothetical protein